jgi:hypothetical protein
MTKKLQNPKMSAGLDMCAKFQVSILIKSWWNHHVKIWWLTHGKWKLIKAFKKHLKITIKIQRIDLSRKKKIGSRFWPREDVCQVSSQNINSKCFKPGRQKHPEKLLLDMAGLTAKYLHTRFDSINFIWKMLRKKLIFYLSRIRNLVISSYFIVYSFISATNRQRAQNDWGDWNYLWEHL